MGNSLGKNISSYPYILSPVRQPHNSAVFMARGTLPLPASARHASNTQDIQVTRPCNVISAQQSPIALAPFPGHLRDSQPCKCPPTSGGPHLRPILLRLAEMAASDNCASSMKAGRQGAGQLHLERCSRQKPNNTWRMQLHEI